MRKLITAAVAASFLVAAAAPVLASSTLTTAPRATKISTEHMTNGNAPPSAKHFAAMPGAKHFAGGVMTKKQYSAQHHFSAAKIPSLTHKTKNKKH